MATFTGSFNEFYQWANARTRFWITQETQDKKRKIGKCAQCNLEKSLTAAHVTPRREVIRQALGVVDEGAQHTWDLDDAWARIKAAHRPFAKAFQYLCVECHTLVDSQGPPSPSQKPDFAAHL